MQALALAGVQDSMQMFSVQLPELNPAALQRTLLDDYNIEIVALRWHDRPLMQTSLQAYNDEHDRTALMSALHGLLS